MTQWRTRPTRSHCSQDNRCPATPRTRLKPNLIKNRHKARKKTHRRTIRWHRKTCRAKSAAWAHGRHSAEIGGGAVRARSADAGIRGARGAKLSRGAVASWRTGARRVAVRASRTERRRTGAQRAEVRYGTRARDLRQQRSGAGRAGCAWRHLRRTGRAKEARRAVSVDGAEASRAAVGTRRANCHCARTSGTKLSRSTRARHGSEQTCITIVTRSANRHLRRARRTIIARGAIARHGRQASRGAVRSLLKTNKRDELNTE